MSNRITMDNITHKGTWRGRNVGVVWDKASEYCQVAYTPDCAPLSVSIDEVEELCELDLNRESDEPITEAPLLAAIAAIRACPQQYDLRPHFPDYRNPPHNGHERTA